MRAVNRLWALSVLLVLIGSRAYAEMDCFNQTVPNSNPPLGVMVDWIKVTQPDPDSEAWHGASVPITWNTCSHPGHLVTLTLVDSNGTSDGSTRRTTIASALPNSGTFTWQVGSFQGGPAANNSGTPPSAWNAAAWGSMGPNIKIEVKMDPANGVGHSHTGESPLFWIIPRPNITVTEPAANVTWRPGQMHTVKWTIDDVYWGPKTKITLKLGPTDAPTKVLELGTVDVTVNQLDWTIPTDANAVPPNTAYYIEITPVNPTSSNKPYGHKGRSANFLIQLDTSKCTLAAVWGLPGAGPAAMKHLASFRALRGKLRLLPGGRQLVRSYYRLSPPVAVYLTTHALARGLMAVLMEPIARGVEAPIQTVLLLGFLTLLLQRRRLICLSGCSTLCE